MAQTTENMHLHLHSTGSVEPGYFRSRALLEKLAQVDWREVFVGPRAVTTGQISGFEPVAQLKEDAGFELIEGGLV